MAIIEGIRIDSPFPYLAVMDCTAADERLNPAPFGEWNYRLGMSGTSRIFVINLDRRTDRLALMSARLENLGLKWERVAAIDSENPTLDVQVDWHKHRYYTQMLPLRKAPIACYFSHRLVWQRMVDESIEQALILEDDVAATSQWDTGILNIDLAAHGLDSLRLDHSRDMGPMPKAAYFEQTIGRWTVKNHNSWGAGATLMTRVGAEKCLSLEKMWFMVDDYFMMNRVLGLKTALAIPSLWWHPEETPSDVAPPLSYWNQSNFIKKAISMMVTARMREAERSRIQKLRAASVLKEATLPKNAEPLNAN